MKLARATVVPYGESFLLVGGYVDGSVASIYRYEPEDGSWELLSGEMSARRYWTAAVMVQKESFPGC